MNVDAEDDIPPLLSFDPVSNSYILPTGNTTLLTSSYYIPHTYLHYTYYLTDFKEDNTNKIYEFCMILLDEACKQEGIEFLYEDDIYDGISGEDIVKGESIFIINDSWMFPLKYITLKTMFNEYKLENPHHKEPIQRILKLIVQ